MTQNDAKPVNHCYSNGSSRSNIPTSNQAIAKFELNNPSILICFDFAVMRAQKMGSMQYFAPPIWTNRHIPTDTLNLKIDIV